MAEHGGQFRFGIEIGENAARDVDITARQGKGVDFRRIQHGEMVLQIGAVAMLRDFLPTLST